MNSLLPTEKDFKLPGAGPRKSVRLTRLGRTPMVNRLVLADQRTVLGRRYSSLVAAFAETLGGRENITAGQLEMIKGAATLAISVETLSAQAVAADPAFDVTLLGNLLDRLGRALQRAGCMKSRVPMVDVTGTSFDNYVAAAKRQTPEPDDDDDAAEPQEDVAP